MLENLGPKDKMDSVDVEIGGELPGVGPVVSQDMIFEEDRDAKFEIKGGPARGIALGIKNVG